MVGTTRRLFYGDDNIIKIFVEGISFGEVIADGEVFGG